MRTLRKPALDIHSLVVWSAIAFLALGALTFAATVHISRSKSLVKGDGVGYYLYAWSLTEDLDSDVSDEFKILDSRFSVEETNMMSAVREWAHRSPATGRISLPWPIGSGLVMMPFFALGYGIEALLALVARRDVDPVGLVPQFFFCSGSLFYGALGLVMTTLGCHSLVNGLSARKAGVAMVFAGSVSFYIFFQPSMMHAASFGLASTYFYVWATDWRRHRTRWLLHGALLGLLTIVRLQNALFFLLLIGPLLNQLRQGSPRATLRSLLLIAVGSLPFFGLEVLHNLYIGGIGLQAPSAGDPTVIGAKQNLLDLTSPRFLSVLTSCNHGLFYWTPIAAFGVLGLLLGAFRHRWAVQFLVTFLAQVYLIGCLTETDLSAHAFGMRYLIESTPLLTAGLAYLLNKKSLAISQKAWSVLLPALAVWNWLLILAVGLNTLSSDDCVSHLTMVQSIWRALQSLIPI